MKGRTCSLIVLCVNCALFYCCGSVEGSPTSTPPASNDVAVNKFQGALQQQNFLSIVTSIEERLRNLDNIYTMQLSQTLENKLDQYSRKLESLDKKIIRLEALVMLNLDKISENISTKNFKDDVSKTNTMRKVDSVYEGISHRLSYMDRKYETQFTKVQSKLDTTLMRLEKIQESVATKESDVEGELSDAIFAIDDLKTTYSEMEEKLLNIATSTLNITKDNYNYLREMRVDNKESINKLHDNIIENLEYLDNKTLSHFKTTEENNGLLKTMKIELKQDFNDYANKVADMNSYIWKNSDSTEGDLKEIATAVNSTKIEVQNGVRALTLQIGKLSGKDNNIPLGSNTLNEINKKLTANFEKILSNQDLFLESCHRVQMDESQIETEISGMFEKLIDMLENKMVSETAHIKNLEKSLKNHDSRVNRNLYQANTNTISLFEKFTKHDQETKTDINKIKNVLNTISARTQTISLSTNSTGNIKVILGKLRQIEEFANRTSIMQNTGTVQDVMTKIETVYQVLQQIRSELNTTFNEQNVERMFSRVLPKHTGTYSTHNETIPKSSENEIQIDDDTMKAIVDIFGVNPNLQKVDGKSPETPDKKNKSQQDYDASLIDIRHGGEMYEEIEDKSGKSKKKKKEKKKKPYEIDIRGGFKSNGTVEYEDYDVTTDDPLHNLDNVTDEVNPTTEAAEITTSITHKLNTTNAV